MASIRYQITEYQHDIEKSKVGDTSLVGRLLSEVQSVCYKLGGRYIDADVNWLKDDQKKAIRGERFMQVGHVSVSINVSRDTGYRTVKLSTPLPENNGDDCSVLFQPAFSNTHLETRLNELLSKQKNYEMHNDEIHEIQISDQGDQDS
tara:strand:+ start:2473 stop:2916 length:444 start_codon:yes stop_codon:yes gene_type:complete